MRILEDHVKKTHENLTIGIVLCKEANREYVEYVIQDYDKPMGVATYTTSKVVGNLDIVYAVRIFFQKRR